MNSQGNNEDTLDDKDINTFEESSGNKDLNLESNASDEKRQRMTTPPPTTTSNDATTFNVPASPPRYVSMDEIMKAANAVSNLKLAHEIATDDDFKIVAPKVEQDNSLESRVKEVMHKAFWDALRAKLEDDPPNYSFAINLMSEVKQNIFELLLPQHQRLRAHIDEILDIELIEQQVDNESLDFKHYAEFIISIMAKLCAPARDEQVAALRSITDIPDLFKSIFSVLEVLKMDMANFTIQQIRPFVQQQSVDYEKKKFDELLKQQEESNLDGLQLTKKWLQRNADKLYAATSTQQAPTQQAPTQQAPTQQTPTQRTSADEVSKPASDVTPSMIMNTSFAELLTWQNKMDYPETMLIDYDRLSVISDAVHRLTCVASVMLVTYHTAGASLASLTKFKTTLKEKILAVIGDVPLSDLRSHMLNVSDIVLSEVTACLDKHGYNTLSDAQNEMLKDQIVHITDCDNTVHTLIKNRITNFFQQLISTSKPESIRFPAGVSSLSTELSKLGGHYLKLVSHNRAVFGSYYADIISNIIKTKEFSDTLSNSASASV